MSQFYEQLATLTPEQRALLEKKLAAKGLEKGLQMLGKGTSIPKRPEHQPIPLSFAQQRLWFVQQLDPQNTAYNVASVLELEGELNVPALEKSLNALVERHETFRTHFELQTNKQGEQQPIQIIDAPKAIRLNVEDLSEDTHTESNLSVADTRIHSLTQAPFDLSQPLLRTALLK
ncbi:MAG: condensation domain-containing protein, partial [Cyanobacteria bacterium J06632_3]